MGCGTANIERRLKSFSSDMNIGFTLDAVISDLSSLKNHKTHEIEEGSIRETYQKVLDACVKNKVNHKALIYLIEIRDGKISPEPVIGYVIRELSWLNKIYLSRTQRAVEEGMFRR